MANLYLAVFAAVCASAAAQVPVPVLLSAQSSSQPRQVIRIRQPTVEAAEARQPRFVSRPSAASLAAANLLEEASSYQPINPYNFGYDIRDEFGNHQYRKEEADERGVVRGSYGYTDAAGVYRFVDYVADASGFKANIRSNEPGVGAAHAADITLAAEEPPRAVLELASAPRPQQQFPSRRVGSQRDGIAAASAPQAYTEIQPLSRNERLRYAVPLPSASTTVSASTEAPSASSPIPRGRFNQ